MSEDLRGKRFNRLTVIDQEKRENTKRHYWRCLCDCGNETVVEESHLKGGHTKSCGCYRRDLPREKRVDLRGRRFGRLVALGPAKEKVGKDYWECVCDCGNKIICQKENLCSGNTKSCGCLQAEIRKLNMKKAIHFVGGTCLERIASRRNTANNTSGQRGVYRRENDRWRALIGFQGKVYNLGTFIRYEDAVEARRRAEEELYDPILQKYGTAGENGSS